MCEWGNSLGLSRGRYILKEDVRFIQKVHTFADVVCRRDAPRWRYWGIMDVKGGKFLICLLGARIPTVFVIEQQPILFLKKLMRNKNQ